MENIHHLITTTRPWYTRIISVSISISQENPNKVFTLPAETGPSHKTVSRNTKPASLSEIFFDAMQSRR